MSSSTGTRGRRHPPAVYRRRRVVALLVLLLLLAAVAWGVSAFLGRGADATPEPAGAEVDAPTPTEEPSPGRVGACTAADLEADVALETASTAAGTGTSFQVTVRNTGTGPCLVDAGPASLAATVASGSDTVWSSAHCAGDATKELLLDADAETAVTVRWDGRRSVEGCPAEQPFAEAGTYRVALELAGEPLGTREAFTVG